MKSKIPLLTRIKIVSYDEFGVKKHPAQDHNQASHHAVHHGPFHQSHHPYFLFILLAGLLIGLMLGKSMKSNNPLPSSSSNNQPTTHNSQLTTNNPQPSAGPRIIYEITANNDKFNPSEIHAKLGQIVSLFIYSTDKIYDVVIPALNMEKQIYPGDKRFMEFQAVKAGSYAFSCKNCAASARGVVIVENR